MFIFIITNQVVKVAVQKNKFEGIHKVIFINDQFATGGVLLCVKQNLRYCCSSMFLHAYCIVLTSTEL